MAKKHIDSLLSLMVFTGNNANNNALALEDREYGYEDEVTNIGKLNLTRTYDSAFSNFPDEIFVETTPKYKSVDDLTYLSYAYITNKLSKKGITPDGTLYVDEAGTFNVIYDYDKNLKSNYENSEWVPFDDVKLYLTSINNSLYNKQRYYQKVKELQSISNSGVKFNWMPDGTVLKNTYDNIDYNVGNDFISYSTYTSRVQKTEWDEETSSYVPVFEEVTDADGNKEQVPVYVNVTGFNYLDSYYEVIEDKLKDITYNFSRKFEDNEDLVAYYIYKLNSTIPFVMNTYSFGQNIVNANINYDGEFNNWFHNRISFNAKDLRAGDVIAKFIPGEKYWFNAVLKKETEDFTQEYERFLGKDFNTDSETKYVVNEDVNDLKDVSILSPYKIKSLDLSNIADKLYGALDLTSQYDKFINYKDTISTNWNKEKGNMLEELIIGKDGVECKITDIIGLNEFTNLKNLVLTGCNNLTDNPDLSEFPNLENVDLSGSSVSVFKPAKGSNLRNIILSEEVESIILTDINFDGYFIYTPNKKLTTLELNNVTGPGIDTYMLIHDWLKVLESEKLLTSGLVNYVNINDVDWENVEVNDLLNLKKIELNEFTGTVNVHGIGLSPVIYRKDYVKLIEAYGRDNINNSKSPLNIVVELQENAFKANCKIIEQYEDSTWTTDEYGNPKENIEIKDRDLVSFTLTALDTDTGNSLLDLFESNKTEFTKFSLTDFVNNNKINIGWQKKLSKPLSLPKNSEKLEQLEQGDVLLYDKDVLVFVTKNIANVNQNFTKLGNIKFNIYDFDEVLNLISGIKAGLKWFMTIDYTETKIEPSPIKDVRHYIALEFNSNENEIKLFNKPAPINENNSIEVKYKSWFYTNLLHYPLDENNSIENVYEGDEISFFKQNVNLDKNNMISMNLEGWWKMNLTAGENPEQEEESDEEESENED